MRTPDVGLVLGFVGLAFAAATSLAFAKRPPSAAGAPSTGTRADTVTSGACRSCHPAEYASWHRSFHRTMTRLATPATVAGSFDGTRVETEGRTVELSRRGDELWAKLPDPDEVARLSRAGVPEPSRGARLVSRRVVLATGSHHHEVYWVAGGAENELRLVPVTYVIAEKRFIPRRDAFLQPPDAAPHAVRWNSNCIQCHTTLGRPGHDERAGRFESEAVELGIACEACHGAGAAHIQKHQNPFERYAAHFSKAPDESIVNPARLAHDRASEICGQCHSYFVPNDENRWWKDGFAGAYRPGDTLARSRTLLAPADFGAPADEPHAVAAEADAKSAFWSDGTMRVGGREQSALRTSACYTKGSEKRRISCLSCHSMHASEPDDQLRRGDVNDACRRCHESIAARTSEHTHHARTSSGSSCVACHMPYTSYALFKAIRSHRIDSPSVVITTESERPNACNLCHLDRSLAWTQKTIAAWYGAKTLGSAPTEPNATETSFAAELLLAGDAADRAVLAWAFGRPEARAASGAGWEAPYLAALLDDPYSAVRFIAERSLRSFPGFSNLDYDFLALPERRRAARDAVLARFASERARIEALVARRDDRSVSISE
ncbi:MAG TPA: ammonia-forming cytochrome c nitrite reductase subunit c552 [Polyangiaceae bacterium]